MRVCLVGKYPPIQGGVSQGNFWTARALADTGVDVHVVTNAAEVEEEFRIVDLDAWLPQPCTPDYSGDGVTVHGSCTPTGQAYIPWSNPFVTKLAALATDVARANDCDLILGSYFEPYGIAAHLAARWTGIPYGLAHAGSDVGRLFQDHSLRTSYAAIIASADFILATRRLAPAFRADGVAADRIYPALSPAIHERWFHPEAAPLDLAKAARACAVRLPQTYLGGAVQAFSGKHCDPVRPTIGMYGKLGDAKGSFDLVSALGQLVAEGKEFNVVLATQGEPQMMSTLRREIIAQGLAERTWLLPFIPHWRIPGLIRACTAVCFLERGFPIAVHGPVVPAEIVACGCCLVMSPEIVVKQRTGGAYRHGYNALIAEPRNRHALATALRLVVDDPAEARQIGRRGHEELHDSSGFGHSALTLRALFDQIHADCTTRRTVMSIAEMQAALGRLCADGGFRQLFELEPEATLESYKLSDAERNALKLIDRKMMDSFAHSLKAKRLARFRAAYPLSFQAVPQREMARYAERYYELHPAFPGESDLDSIERFGRFMQGSLDADQDVPFYAADLIQYERLYRLVSLSTLANEGLETINDAPVEASVVVAADCRPRISDGLRIGVFRCDIVTLLEHIKAGTPVAPSQEPGSEAVIFQRMRRQQRIAVFRISEAVRVLLESCNGRRTPDELVNECERRLKARGLADSIHQMLTSLAERHLVTL